MSAKPFNVWDKRSLKIQMENLQNLLVYLESIPVKTPCGACTQYEQGHCKKWDMDVPSEAREEGCADFDFNPQAAPF